MLMNIEQRPRALLKMIAEYNPMNRTTFLNIGEKDEISNLKHFFYPFTTRTLI